MKKIGLFIVSVFALSLTFTGCGDENSDAAASVETVSVASVVPAGTVQKKAVTNAEEFQNYVAEAIGEDLETYFGGLFDSDDEDTDPVSGPLTNKIARAAGTVTIKQLTDALEGVPAAFSEGVTPNEETGAMTINVDWKGPTGKIDTGDSPVELAVTSLSINVKAAAVPVSETVMKATGSSAASAGGSISLVPENAAAVKSLKLNALAGASVTNLVLETNPQLEGLEAITSFSGNYYLYAGASGALCFEVGEGNDVYNGVIAVNATVSIDTSASKEVVAKASEIIASIQNDEEEFNPAALDELPVSVSFTVSVYDVEGNKQFDLANITKPSELYALIAGEEEDNSQYQ